MLLLVGRLIHRALVRRRGASPVVARVLVLLAMVNWVRRRFGPPKTLVLDPSESYEIVVESGQRGRARGRGRV